MHGDMQDRFVGALLGGAIGDSLGSFCEGWSRERILEVADLTGCYRERVGRNGEVVRAAGAYTDDTQQTLVVVESILACGKVDPADVARRYLEMWRAGELYAYGGAFRETMERMDAGASWEEAASVDQPSNGTVMKIGPVGLWDWQRGEAIRDDAVALSRVTHRDPRAVAGAVAVAHAVGYVLAHRPLDAAELIEVAAELARPIHAVTGEMLGGLRKLLEMSGEAACRTMLEVPECPIGSGQGIPGEAPVTALVALEAFLRTPDDYEATVRRALQMGGDVDTFAAVAGTLSGAYNGAEALPGHLVEGLLEAEEEIRRLGEALYRKTVEGADSDG